MGGREGFHGGSVFEYAPGLPHSGACYVRASLRPIFFGLEEGSGLTGRGRLARMTGASVEATLELRHDGRLIFISSRI